MKKLLVLGLLLFGFNQNTQTNFYNPKDDGFELLYINSHLNEKDIKQYAKKYCNTLQELLHCSNEVIDEKMDPFYRRILDNEIHPKITKLLQENRHDNKMTNFLQGYLKAYLNQ